MYLASDTLNNKIAILFFKENQSRNLFLHNLESYINNALCFTGSCLPTVLQFFLTGCLPTNKICIHCE